MATAHGSITFILRIVPDAGGRLRGVVQRVLTREACRFKGDARLVEILREAVRREGTTSPGTAPMPHAADAEPRSAPEPP